MSNFVNPFPYGILRGAQPMAYGLSGLTESMTFSVRIEDNSDDVMLG